MGVPALNFGGTASTIPPRHLGFAGGGATIDHLMPAPHEGRASSMRRARRQLGSILLSTVAFAALCTGAAQAGGARAPSPMETIAFPVTTDSPAARTAFERGMVALHSFAYSDAVEAFRAATAADPGFVMGYWGEAMALNRPVWNEQDTAGGRAAVAKLEAVKLPPNLTPRERALVATVPLLYRGEDKRARDQAYLAAIERVGRDFPDDDEITCLRALAAMGAGRTIVAAGGDDLGLRMRAAALALEVFHRNPNHPGAAHYAIHALDDPEHAILALPAAQHYAKAAPDAYHAIHMPSHIFVQLGMWPEARAANEAAWASSLAWAARKTPPSGQRDTHSLSWLGFIQLQEGRKAAATATLATLRETAVVRPTIEVRVFYYAQLAGSLLAETGGWSEAAALYDPVVPTARAVPGPVARQRPAAGGGGGRRLSLRRYRGRCPARRWSLPTCSGRWPRAPTSRGWPPCILAARPTPSAGSGRCRR